MLPILYKMDSTGNIRTWSIRVLEDGTSYSVTHGLLGGSQQETLVEVTSGKNAGRANATTPQGQCRLDAESAWNKQKDRKGYTEHLPTTQPNLPMLAHPYAKHKHKVKFPAIVSVKIDGLRCIMTISNGIVSSTSRTGLPYTGLDHITKELSGLDDIVLDGELYSSTLTFEEIQSVVRGGKANDPRMSQIFYYVFDIVNDEIYHQRVISLDTIACGLSNVKAVPWYIVRSHEEIDTKHAAFVAEGYEGSMVRNIKGLYQANKRSTEILKKKDFLDEEFKIVGWKTGKGKFEQVPIFLLLGPGGTFEATPEGDELERSQLLENADNLIGKFATVRFFGYTSKNIPRFPIFVRVREVE